LPEAPGRKKETASATKRKRDSSEVVEVPARDTTKRRKAAAARVEDVAMNEAPPHIWAEDSSEESDF
jgi:hypothetical protein